MALQQKAFDGQENPIPLIYAAKLYEVQKFLTITNHVYEPMPLVIGKNFLNGLTAQQQDVIRKSAIEARSFNRQLIKTQTDQMLGELEKAGMTVIRPDIDTFKQATKDVRLQFLGTFGEKLINDAYNFTRK